jgi:hypothetical protein
MVVVVVGITAVVELPDGELVVAGALDDGLADPPGDEQPEARTPQAATVVTAIHRSDRPVPRWLKS